MSPAALFLATKARLWRTWVDAQAGRPVRSLLTVAVTVAIWAALYAIFLTGFRYAELVAYLDTYLISGLFGVFFLLMLLLLVLTSIVLNHYGLYQSPEAALFMHLPLAPERGALYRSGELSLLNSLGAIWLITPLLCAYAVHQQVPPRQLGPAVLLLAPLLVIPNCIGVGITVWLRRLVGHLPTRVFLLGGVLIALAAFYTLLNTFDFAILAADDHPVRMLNRTANALRGTRAWFLPSYWYVEAVFSPVRGYPRMAWWYGGILTTVAAVGILGWVATIRWAYYASWLADSRAPAPGAESRQATVNRLALWAVRLRPLPAGLRTMLAKDALLFVREPVVRTQGLVMMGLLVVYFASLGSLYTGLADEPTQRLMISVMNFAALGIFLAAFGCRFLLPLVSVEGRKFWMLRSAPPRLSHLLAEKWVFGVIVLVGLGQPLLLLSNYMTSMDRVFVLVSHTALFSFGPALAAVCIGLGAAFPDLTGEGGHTGAAATLAFLVSVALLAIFLAVLGLPYVWYAQLDSLTYGEFLQRLTRNLVGGSLIAWGMGMLVLLIGHQRLREAELP